MTLPNEEDDCGELTLEERDAVVGKVYGKIMEIESRLLPCGLHTVGVPPTAEEAMLADVRRQFEALRMTGVVVAAARASRQQQCVVCFDDFDAAGGGSCGGDHSICADCLSGHVARELEVVSEDNDRLAAHRQRGGRIRCASYGGPGGCGSDYSDRTLARCLAPAVFEAYRAAQDRTVEDRIFAGDVDPP